jgi:predicted esterase
MSLDLYTHRFVPATVPGLPTIVALHGTGGNEHDLIGLTQTIAPGCAIISPRGNVSERGMPRFFKRFAEGVFDLEDVQRRAGELASFVASAAINYQFDAKNVYALGYSNGANIAIATLLLHPQSLRGGIFLRAQTTYTPEVLPNLSGKALFIGAGRADQLIPATQSDELQQLLQRAGASTTLSWQNANHGLVQGDVEMAAGWFNALIA